MAKKGKSRGYYGIRDANNILWVYKHCNKLTPERALGELKEKRMSDRFDFGNDSPETSLLSYAILLDFSNNGRLAIQLYMDFKADFLKDVKSHKFSVDFLDVRKFLKQHDWEGGL